MGVIWNLYISSIDNIPNQFSVPLIRKHCAKSSNKLLYSAPLQSYVVIMIVVVSVLQGHKTKTE